MARKTVTRPPAPKRLPEGFVRFVCQRHGWVTDTFPEASAWCPCGAKAKVESNR